ncbi:glycoside hydrolase family 2 protein [Salinimonas sp. HHU 13199]|uniref:Glycoside hydrolase family 2 protein n=1 Tax=Salinimonas profundi TaxID=2729140 RepID=A0ABR8LFY2_9ALTE|nr:glycoside hydrolase family 2 protein [Salinimonas profundi]
MSTSQLLLLATFSLLAMQPVLAQERERISFNEGWRFFKYASMNEADSLIYDVRPEILKFDDSNNADAKPTDAIEVKTRQQVLKPWVMPTGNDFIANPSSRYVRPPGNPGEDFPFVQPDFNDSDWKIVNLPHDWAIKGPFFTGKDPEVGGGMGRLPSHGVAWYRNSFTLNQADADNQIYLDIDGAMSYSMVWLNGQLVGGWPYGYSSYRLDLTPHIKVGEENQLAIRLDNPPKSSRWYPGGGIYRNVWLVKTSPVHVKHWGTQVISSNISSKSADIAFTVALKNHSDKTQELTLTNQIFELDKNSQISGDAVASFDNKSVILPKGEESELTASLTLKNPKLWGPLPKQQPNRYTIVTNVMHGDRQLDTFHTNFGIRSLRFDPDSGVYVNGQHIPLQGVNQHHDLGPLGAAFNLSAAKRQLEVLKEMGVNAIRMAHNPPAPELLELTDKMGILVLNESFDSWYKKKTPLDFHLIFADWHEQDLRALVRRDRNHPSVIMWYIGNEVGEQYTGEDGARIARQLKAIVKSEDPTRPVTASMNWAKADFPFTAAMDLISLNYQGEGIRQLPEFEGTDRIRTPPSYPAFHQAHPDKVILSSETASAFSSRGIYLFPVTDETSAPVRDGRGGDSTSHQVSSYELHAVDFGSSADKVFKYLDRHPFVAGQFVWNGWDYIGEPTPYYSSRSSYSGMIDLAGFKKDRFYIYQSEWRPELPMVHILPHWNWHGREGKITPVHIFTSGDEVELFVNGKSQGRKKKGAFEYRLRFDNVRFQPGTLKAVAYKEGKKWAVETVKTSGKPAGMRLSPDHNVIDSDEEDLSFITLDIIDANGQIVPTATNEVKFSVSGNGRIIATANGDSTNFTPFPSPTRKAFSGKVLVIVKSKNGQPGSFTVTANSEGLESAHVKINVK